MTLHWAVRTLVLLSCAELWMHFKALQFRTDNAVVRHIKTEINCFTSVEEISVVRRFMRHKLPAHRPRLTSCRRQFLSRQVAFETFIMNVKLIGLNLSTSVFEPALKIGDT